MLTRLKVRLRALFRKGQVERELDEELQYHVEKDLERRLARGVTPEEARSAVARGFGNVEVLKEESRDARGTRLVEDLVADLRYALRVLRGSPGFTTVAILTIALGMGTNTAIFSVVDVVLLKTMPVREPGQLFFLDVVESGDRLGAPPYPCFERFRDGAESFAGITAFTLQELTLTIDGRTERVLGQLASANYFDVLGVEPILGRTFEPVDERLDPAVAVLSHRYWQRRFGGSPDVLGQAIRYEERTLTVVGVAPPEFFGLAPGSPVDVTVPITVAGAERLHDSGSWWFSAVARLKPDVSREQARAEIDPLFQRFLLDTGRPAEIRNSYDRMELTPASRGLDYLRAQFSKPLLILAAIVGLVLLIACANIANLLLARAAARRQELAVRTALGASRLRLVRQLATESLLLFTMGSVAGLLFAKWGAETLVGFLAVGRHPKLIDAQLDVRVLVFTALLCLISAMLFGLMPAVRGARVEAHADIKEGSSRATTSRRHLRAGRLLVVFQVTLSLVLLVGAGLFIRTLSNLKATDLGFRADHVLTFRIEPLMSAYPVERLQTLWATLLARSEAMPGVRSASLSRYTPLSGTLYGRGINIAGFNERSKQDQHIYFNEVSPEYFETMGIPLRLGRAFTPHDGPTAPRVAILSETAARFYFGDDFGDDDPLGARVEVGGTETSEGSYGGTYEVVGVVADSKYSGVRDDASGFLYVPVRQPISALRQITLSIRATDTGASLMDAIRHEIRALDAEILVTDIATMEQQIDRVLLRERLVAMLSGGFGMLGLLLAAIGLYGVMSYAVVRRTNEIGIRMALGASAAAVRGQIVREALIMAGGGVLVGLPLSVLAARAAAGLLFGVQPTDVATLSVSASVLMVVATIAGYLPARRASRIDPMVALRHE